MKPKKQKALTKKGKAKLSKREAQIIKSGLIEVWLERADDRILKQRAADLAKAILYVTRLTKR